MFGSVAFPLPPYIEATLAPGNLLTSKGLEQRHDGHIIPVVNSVPRPSSYLLLGPKP